MLKNKPALGLNPLSNMGRSIKRTKIHTTAEPSSCGREKQMTFAMSGIHSGPNTDLTSLLTWKGQKTLHFSHDFANYPTVYSSPLVETLPTKKQSDVLIKYRSHSTKFRVSWPALNRKFFQRNGALDHVDAFVCSFPASMCQIWSKFTDKSVVVLTAHRYNLGRCMEGKYFSIYSL